MKNKRMRTSTYGIVLLLLFTGLIVSVLTAVVFGNASLTIQDVYRVLLFELFHVPSCSSYGSGAVHDVVWLIRVPRVLMALAVGMGLSVCGVVMQAIVRNPLADPYVLGISSGAYLGAAAFLILEIPAVLQTQGMGIMAFLGAFGASVIVMLLAGAKGRVSSGKLILSGMAVSSVCSAFANFLIYLSQNRDAAAQISYWSMGSLATADWDRVPPVLLIMAGAVLVFWLCHRNLNLMLLGEDTAVTLGSDLHKVRIGYLLLASFMVGTAVCAAGMIGFVGLIIPHAVRMCIGTDHRRLIPVSALSGAIFLIWSDVACRVILEHAELPIGILVSMIGAPCFIYLMIKKSYRFGGGES